MSRFRFLRLFLALSALLVAAVGTLMCVMELQSWNHQTIRECVHGEHGVIAEVAVLQVLGGLAVAALMLLLDLLMAVGGSAGRRSAVGINVLVQVALAVTLLVGVNVYSFLHYARWDCTRD